MKLSARMSQREIQLLGRVPANKNDTTRDGNNHGKKDSLGNEREMTETVSPDESVGDLVRFVRIFRNIPAK
jgi:hypothetical protein